MNEPGNNEDQQKGAANFTVAAESHVEAPARANGQNEKQGTEDKRKRIPDKLAGFSPIFEAAVALCAILGLIGIGLQVYYMSESLRLTRESNASSDKTSQKILEKMEGSNKATRGAVTESKRLADAASRANDLTSELALANEKRASDATRREERFFRLAHRARLGNVVIEKIDLQPNRVLEVKANYRNDPASLPAEHVVARAQTLVTGWDTPLPKTLTFVPPLMGEIPEIVVGPGATPFVPAVWSTTEPVVVMIRERRLRWYFYGHITYTDAFKTDGLLEFCFFYLASANDWRYCKDHNIVK